MKDITGFINEELKPRLYGHIPEIFPEYHFTKRGGKWISHLHNDGSEGSDNRPDRCQVSEKHPTAVWDNPRQEAKPIIDLFMERHGLELWEAVNRLCAIVGIPEPEKKELTPEQKERYRDFEKRRKILEESIRRQALALYQPKSEAAAAVKDYVYRRGFTDWDLFEKMAEGQALLGYINEEEVNRLAEAGILFKDTRIGKVHTLSIPLYSGSTLCGIKFRTINKNVDKKDRYTGYSLYGEDKDLYNLTGIKKENGSIVVVESELDVLLAEYNGLKDFVATSGGGLTDKLLAVVKKRGIKRITLLLDIDKAGVDFVRNSMAAANKKGISILVATIPGGESLPDGTLIHDVGEYLQAHTKEELQSLINNAVSGSIWLLRDIITTYNNGETTHAKAIDTINRVIDLANHTPNEIERDLVLTECANTLKVDKDLTFTAEAMRAVADKEREAEDAVKSREEAVRGFKEALSLAEKGDTKNSLQAAEETIAKAKSIGDREKYGDLLKTPTRDERIAKFKEKPEALKTHYQFTEGGEAALPFVIPSGALTIIAAPTSHGKSTFLRNLAIDVAKRYGDKSTLYFTFEESEEDVIAQFVNTYIGKRLHASSYRHPQLYSIIDYYKTGTATYIGGSQAEIQASEFERKEKEFFSNFLDNGKIRIFYKEDYDLETLIDALEFAVSNIPTRAIFIDYIQILRSMKLSRQPRTDQLKEICISLKDFSVKHKIPVVLAAQLNREATTPLRMANTQMAESSDIEKAANTIICLWNSKFNVMPYGDKKPKGDEKDEIEALEKNKNFVLGTEGKIFALVTKMRGSRGVGMYSIFDFKGYCGKIVENYNPNAEQLDLFEQERPIIPF